MAHHLSFPGTETFGTGRSGQPLTAGKDHRVDQSSDGQDSSDNGTRSARVSYKVLAEAFKLWPPVCATDEVKK